MINRVVLVGRLTRDPELRYTPQNIPVARFTIAVNRTFVASNGERETDFINCVVWRKPAENMAKYLSKGSLVGVEGRIQTGSYDAQDGTKRYTTEVICDSIQFLESKSSRNAAPNNDYGNYGNNNNGYNNNNFGNQTRNNNQANQFPTINLEDDFEFNTSKNINIKDDDDLPF